MMGPLRQFLHSLRQDRPLPPMPDRSLPCSWVLNGQLAIGPMPRTARHWQQLEEAGIRSRFSCCYPEEESALIVPPAGAATGSPCPTTGSRSRCARSDWPWPWRGRKRW